MPCDINHNWPMQAYNLSPPDITGSGSCVVQNHTTFFYSNFPEKLLEADMNQGVATLWEDTHLFAALGCPPGLRHTPDSRKAPGQGLELVRWTIVEA
jgi:hypothetical protein